MASAPFWVAMICQIIIVIGYFWFYRKEQLGTQLLSVYTSLDTNSSLSTPMITTRHHTINHYISLDYTLSFGHFLSHLQGRTVTTMDIVHAIGSIPLHARFNSRILKCAVHSTQMESALARTFLNSCKNTCARNVHPYICVHRGYTKSIKSYSKLSA